MWVQVPPVLPHCRENKYSIKSHKLDPVGALPTPAPISGCKSMVDGLLWEQEAGGSNPLTQTKSRFKFLLKINKNGGYIIKKIICFLLIVIILTMMIGVNIYGDNYPITVNIYTNGELVATDSVAWEVDMEYGTFPCGYLYGDLYGETLTSSCTINGTNGVTFDFDAPNTISFFKSDYSCATSEDNVVINLFYTKEVEEIEEPIVYGSMALKITGTYGEPLANEIVYLYGIKGADHITSTLASDENGNINVFNLDESYSWTFSFNEVMYNVIFENHYFYTDLVKPTGEIVAPEIVTGNEHTVSLTYEYKFEAGGTMIDGHSTNSVAQKEITFTAMSGDTVDLTNYAQNPPGAIFVENGNNGIVIELNNNRYRLGTIYKTIHGEHSESPLIFTMEDKDVNITLSYTFVETVIEPEVVEVEVEIIKEVPTVVEKPVIHTVPVTVVEEKIVEKEVQVTPEPVPMPTPQIIEVVEIDEQNTPTNSFDENAQTGWSIINLILMLASACGLIKFEDRKYNLLNILFAIGSILVFVFTEYTNNPVILVDKYTWIMVLIFIAQFINIWFLTKNNNANME